MRRYIYMASLPKQKNHDILIDLSLSLKQIQIDLDEIKTNISHIKNDIRVQKIQNMKKQLPKDDEPEQSGWWWRS